MTDFVVKNRTVELVIGLKRRDGSIFDMTGRFAQIAYRIGDGIAKIKLATNLTPPTDGKIKYIFELVGGLDDLYASGQMYAEVHVFDEIDGALISSAEILQLVVRDAIKQP